MYGEIGMVERRIASIQRHRTAPSERRPLRILLVEDDPTDARLAHRLLERSPRFDVEVVHCADPASAVGAMVGGGYDLWLLDYWIGCTPSSQVVATAGEAAREGVAVVLLTGSHMGDVEDDAYEHGATVCLGKIDVNGGTLDSAITAALRAAERSDDVADLRELAERRTAAMGDLAHEVGNVLNASRMTLALEAMDPRPERARDTIDLLGGQIEQLHEAARAMLHEAELCESASAGVETVRALAARIEPLCRPIVEGDGRRFGLVVADDVAGATVASGVLIAQVVLNLVVNAAKYSPPGGAIEVEIGRSGGAGTLSLRVLDDGAGLAPARLDALTRRGARGKAETASGHGLGLALVARFAERMGGALESREAGTGRAYVECRVPLAPAPFR